MVSVIIFLFLNTTIVANLSSDSAYFSPTKNYEDDQKNLHQQYMNDWHVHLRNSGNTTKRDISFNEKEEARVHVVLEPIAGSMDGLMNSSWPMCLHDPRHTAQSPYSTANNPDGVEKWMFRTIYEGPIESGAVIDRNGTIYFGSMGSDRRLYALFPNGTIKWVVNMGGSIWSDPVIADDGTVYVCSWDDYLHAVFPNGTVKWTFYTGTDLVSSPAIAEDGTIYFGGFNGYIYAVNPNGTKKWWYLTNDFIQSAPAIGDDGTVYIGSSDCYLYALYPNGTLKWRFQTGDWIKGNPSIASDGTIYVPSFDGYLYAVDPNGTKKWQVSIGSSIAARSAALASDGTLYVGAELLRAFYPNGMLKWTCDLGGDVYGSCPAISGDGTIYISAGASLVAVNSNGTVQWKKQIADVHAKSSPCIGENGTVYVGSTMSGNFWYGILHAFGTEKPKKIEIEQPEAGKLYLFGQDLGATPRNNTVILGSVNVKVHAYSEDEIESIHFYVDGSDQYNVTSPPFEWKMNHRYGKWPLMKHTITVTAYYKGGCEWSESIPVWYFHLLKN